MTTTPEKPSLTIIIELRGYAGRIMDVAGWPTEVPGLAVVKAPHIDTDVPLYTLVHVASGRTFGMPWSSLQFARRAADVLEAELHQDWTTTDISPALQPSIYRILGALREDLRDWPVGRTIHITGLGRAET